MLRHSRTRFHGFSVSSESVQVPSTKQIAGITDPQRPKQIVPYIIKFPTGRPSRV